MDFQQELSAKTAEIENIIAKFLPPVAGPQKTVLEAMNYGMAAGGKRLRPMLMQETYRLFGGKDTVIEPFMAAIEMIHNYSLIHDDLPAMDNDEYRRGRKTTHAVYGETMGILAGDALLNFAFETAASAFSLELNERTAKALQLLAAKSGIYGMVGGQTVDIESEHKKVGLETVEFIHRNKTGALIEAAMGIGAILAGADEDQQAAAKQIAADVGLAFQIQDDILDVTSTTEALGKPVGSDDKNEKSTYVTLLGLPKAKEMVASLSHRAIDTLHTLPGQNPFLENLITYLITRGK